MKKKLIFRISFSVLKLARIASISFLALSVLSIIFSPQFGASVPPNTRVNYKMLPSPALTLGPSSLTIPVSLNINDVVQLNQIAKVVSKNPVLIASNFETEVHLINGTNFQKTLSIIYFFINAISVFFVLHLMIQVFKKAFENKIFEKETIVILKYISVILITAPIILLIVKIIYRISVSGFVNKVFLHYGNFEASSRSSLYLESTYFVVSAVGGFLFLLTKFFEQANILKQENDLTV